MGRGPDAERLLPELGKPPLLTLTRSRVPEAGSERLRCKLTVKLHMRAKKAFRQLSKAEALITAVADRYTANGAHFRELLDSANASLVRARSTLNSRSDEMPPASEQTNKKGNQAQMIPEFNGNKTDFVRAVVEARGSSGATPRDINEAFAIRALVRAIISFTTH